MAGDAGADGRRRWRCLEKSSMCDGLRVCFTTFGYKIRAVREELLQEPVYLPLVLVQDSVFIPRGVTGFIVPVFWQLSYNNQ